MMLDATQHCDEKITADRLFGWHAALFPTLLRPKRLREGAAGRSGMLKILVGQWRDDSTEPMQVV